MTELVPRRSYEIWTDAENAQLVEWLRDGVTLEDISDRIGRGIGAVASHCTQLLPPQMRVNRADADLVLRTHLTDPDYDWRAGVRSRARRRGRIYWEHASEEVVHAGWDQPARWPS